MSDLFLCRDLRISRDGFSSFSKRIFEFYEMDFEKIFL